MLTLCMEVTFCKFQTQPCLTNYELVTKLITISMINKNINRIIVEKNYTYNFVQLYVDCVEF